MTRQITAQESIRRILSTPLGSRVMMPLYGSLLFELVDKTVNDEWVLDAIRYTYEAIENNEPRVTVKNVDVLLGETVSISVEYEEDGVIDVTTIGWQEVVDAAA